MSTLVQNDTVGTAESTFPADILIEGETIREIRLIPEPLSQSRRRAAQSLPEDPAR